MWGNQLYQSTQLANNTYLPNMYHAQSYFPSNYCFQQCGQLVPFCTELASTQNIVYFLVFPVLQPGKLEETSSKTVNLNGQDIKQSELGKFDNKNEKNKSKNCQQKAKRRRKVIELQNIKDNQGNRNILSNSLKLALKNIRNYREEKYSYLEKIIQKWSLNYTVDRFYLKFNQLLPIDINYIRPSVLRAIFSEQENQFVLILKILIRKFFKQQIYTNRGRQTAMKKLIKAHHIKAGRKLLEYFFDPQLQIEQRVFVQS